MACLTAIHSPVVATLGNEHAVIVEVEATPARTYDEVASTKEMLVRAKSRLNLKPRLLAADSAYGSGKFLKWLVDEKIAPSKYWFSMLTVWAIGRHIIACVLPCWMGLSPVQIQ